MVMLGAGFGVWASAVHSRCSSLSEDEGNTAGYAKASYEDKAMPRSDNVHPQEYEAKVRGLKGRDVQRLGRNLVILSFEEPFPP